MKGSSNKMDKRFVYSVLLFIAIILIGATLRSPISSVGPLVPFFTEDLNISNTMVGFMNTLPLVAFGLFSPFIPKISKKYGMEFTLMISMIVLTAGIWVRGAGDTNLLLFGTLLIGLAIAVGNVISPALIRSAFPSQVGLVTGFYSLSMNIVSALAAGASVSIAISPAFDWRFAMQVWMIFPILAVIVLFIRFPYEKSIRKKVFADITTEKGTSMWTNGFAWVITFYMGLQSLIPYSLFAWLPAILVAQGFNESKAGWLVTVFQLGLLPVTFLAPIIASKMNDQRLIASLGGLFFFIGLFGIAFMPNSLIIPALIFVGLGAGTTFSLAIMFFVLRTRTVEDSYSLSGMAQSIGYLIAAAGPLFLGILSDYTGWTPPLIILMIAAIIIAILGLIAGRPFKIGHEKANSN